MKLHLWKRWNVRFFYSGHSGKEYIIAFPEHISNLTYAQVLITTMVDTIVTIESPHAGVSRTVNVTAANGATVNLPTSLMLRGNAIEQKGVLITSPVDISVYVYSHDSSGKGEAYSAIPVYNLGTSYVGAAYYKGFVSVVALNDNTQVNITPGSTTETYNGRSYRGGDTITIYLSRLSTFQIKGDPFSFNTDINSDKPVSIISGTLCYDKSRHCNRMVENIPPTNSLGNMFIIPQFSEGNNSYYFVYSQGTNYHAHFQGWDYNYSGLWSHFNYLLRYSEVPYRFEISHAGVVIYYSTHYNSAEKPYPSKIVIPALTQYSNNYKYLTPTSVSFSNHIAIMIKADYMSGLRIDNRTIYSMNPEIQGVVAGNALYNALIFNVTAGQHTALHVDSDVTFGMIAYGYRSGETYGFPVGLRL